MGLTEWWIYDLPKTNHSSTLFNQRYAPVFKRRSTRFRSPMQFVMPKSVVRPEGEIVSALKVCWLSAFHDWCDGCSGFSKPLWKQPISPKSNMGTWRITTLEPGHSGFRTLKSTQSIPARELYETFAINRYHGGRNECFMMGITLKANGMTTI